jgi:hypothetical protein
MRQILILSFSFLHHILLAQSINYDTDIQPIFDNSCVVCHSGPNPSAGLNLSSYENVMASNAVDIGNYENSILWQEVSSGDMPNNIANNNLGIPDLSEEQIQLIANWILDLECMTLDCLPEYTCILGECVCVNDEDGDGVCDEFENETSLNPINNTQEKIIQVFDIYGKATKKQIEREILIYLHEDGSVKKEIIIK